MVVQVEEVVQDPGVADPVLTSSGVRIGTPAPAARGFDLDDFAEVADVIAAALRPSTGEAELSRLRMRDTRLADRHPHYPELARTDLMGAGR